MKKVSLFIYWILFFNLLTGCAGGSISVLIPDQKPIPPASFQLPKGVKKQWSKRLPGSLTDLSVSAQSGHLLIATAPDRDSKIQTNQPLLMKYDSKGNLQWQHELSARVRSFAISRSGDFAVVTDYENKITAYNSHGKKLWAEDDFCQPILLEKSHRILCYHDDDSDPDTVFSIYDWKGKKLYTQKTKEDVLSLRVSRDENFIAYSCVNGQAILMDVEGKTLWQAKVQGEIVHLVVSNGAEPKVVVLYDASLKQVAAQQDIAVFDYKGRLKAQGKTPTHVEKLEVSPKGDAVFIYGNSLKGQFLGHYPLGDSFPKTGVITLKPTWSREDPKFADYSSNLFIVKNMVIFGHDFSTAISRSSQLVAYDFNGKLKWNIPLTGDEGSYLQLYGFTEDVKTITAGMDDSTLNVYSLE